MRDMMGPHGTRRAKPPGPARTAPREQHPADLMDQHFTTPGPNESRMADITSARTFTERVHAASTRRRAPAPERGPAGPHRPAHRPGPGRPDHGNPAAPTAGRRPDRADPPPRPRRAVPGHPPRADPVRSRRGRLNGIQGRLPRQCPGPGPEPAVQDRTDPQPPPPPTSTTGVFGVFRAVGGSDRGGVGSCRRRDAVRGSGGGSFSGSSRGSGPVAGVAGSYGLVVRAVGGRVTGWRRGHPGLGADAVTVEGRAGIGRLRAGLRGARVGNGFPEEAAVFSARGSG